MMQLRKKQAAGTVPAAPDKPVEKKAGPLKQWLAWHRDMKTVQDITSDKTILPKKNTGKKVLRAAVWALLGLIFVRGAVSVLKPDPVMAMKRQNEKFMADLAGRENTEFQASAFAANFVQAYYTYEAGNPEDYRKRLKTYFSKNMESDIKCTAKAVYVQPYEVKKSGEGQYDVSCAALVEYTRVAEEKKQDAADPPAEAVPAEAPAEGIPPEEAAPAEPEGDTGLQVVTETLPVYLQVPVMETKTGFVVEDLPMITGAPENGKAENTSFTGQQLKAADADAAEKILNEFFKVYYGENQTKIDYFLHSSADKSRFRGLDGRVKYQHIDKISCYRNQKKENEVLAVVSLSLKDSNGSGLAQRFHMKLVYEKDRWYIQSMDTRTVNLDNSEYIS